MIIVLFLHDADVEVETDVGAAERKFDFGNDIYHEVFTQVTDACGGIDFKEHSQNLSKNQRRNHGSRKFNISVFAGSAFQESCTEFIIVCEALGNKLLRSEGEYQCAFASFAQVQVSVEGDKGTGPIAVADSQVQGCAGVVQFIVRIDIELCTDVKFLVESSSKVDGKKNIGVEGRTDADT